MTFFCRGGLVDFSASSAAGFRHHESALYARTYSLICCVIRSDAGENVHPPDDFPFYSLLQFRFAECGTDKQ